MRCPAITKILAGFLLLALVGGCSLKNPPAQKHFYRIPTLELAGPPSSAHLSAPLTLAIRPLGAAPECDTHFFTYRLSHTEFSPDFYHELLASPAAGVTRILRHHLWNQSDLVPATTPEPPRARLSGTLTQIHADVRTPNQPKAVLSLTLLLEYQGPKTYQPWLQKTYTRILDITDATPETLVRAWASALAEISSELIRDIRKAPPLIPSKK